MEYFHQIKFVDIIEFIGTFAFAVSGIRLASAKKFDLFGAFVVGCVTAVGGGTLRDLFIEVPLFWLQSSVYMWWTLIAVIFVMVFRTKLVKLNNTIFLFDAIGLGLFTVVGVEKTLMAEFHPWVAIVMGVITGSFGGMLRDVMINEIPLLFRKEIYALACVFGAIFFIIAQHLGVNIIVNEIVSAIIVVVIRILSIKYNWHLPILKGEKVVTKGK